MDNFTVDGRIILKRILMERNRGRGWINLDRDRDRWRAVVNAVMNLGGFIKCGEFLDWLRTCWLLEKNSAPIS